MRKLTMDELGRYSASEYAAHAHTNLVLVLDNVRSMHNVGSAFRTADAFGLAKLYLGGITATPPHREIHKTALGAEDTVAWEHAPDTAAVLHRLRAEGYQAVALEQTDASHSLADFRPALGGKYALVFGNEAFGVSDAAIAACDTALEIPQFGTKHSFNIAVSIGIVLWHFHLQAPKP
jgi:23S rRNA (guanosine2251-2'-O)-methyltransferase